MLPSSSTSSPDPLALSYDGQLDVTSSPLKAGRPFADRSPAKSRARRMRESSPDTRASSGEQITLQVDQKGQDRNRSFTFHTPTKAEKSDGERSISPWKIRVTVEAEPEEIKYTAGSDDPVKRRFNQTKPTSYGHMSNTITVKVPLKGADEHSPVKRRGRPRKSGSMPGEESRRSGTPKNPRIRRMGKSTIGNLNNTGEMSQLDGTDTDNLNGSFKRPLDRPRRSDGTGPHGASPTSQPNVQTRSMAFDFSAITPLHQKAGNARLLDNPEIRMGRWMGPNNNLKTTKGRVPTPRKPVGWMEQLDEEPDTLMSSPKGRTNEAHGLVEEDRTCGAETAVEDDTSILDRSAVESEGFSIVSLASLRNQKELAYQGDHGSTPTTHASKWLDRKSECLQNNYTTAEKNIQPTQHTSFQYCSPSSSSRVFLSSAAMLPPLRKNNPVADQDSASQQALGERSHYQAKRATPRRASPVCQPPKPDPKDQQQSPERRKGAALFDGFGDGTRRNLQANFMKGELLARGERGFLSHATSSEGVCSSEQQRSLLETGFHHRLPTPADSVETSDSAGLGETDLNCRMMKLQQSHASIKSYDQMSWQPTRTEPLRGSVDSYSRMSWRHTTPPETADKIFEPEQSELGRTEILQRQYQREREEVIRQIEEANTSQVIVIDSSEFAPAIGEEDITIYQADEKEAREVLYEADIWREEADRGMKNFRVRRSMDTRVEQNPSGAQYAGKSKQIGVALQENSQNLKDLFVEDIRPPRAKIPRTWRRASNADFLYSDEMEDEHFGITPLPEPLNARFTRDGNYPSDIPSNFSRNLPPFEDALRAGKQSPTKSILSSPQRMGSSPPKEVRFASESQWADTHRASNKGHTYEDQAYFSDSGEEHREGNKKKNFLGRSITTSFNEDVDATFVSDARFSSISGGINTSRREVFELDTSDVRQLKRELHDLAEESSLTAKATTIAAEDAEIDRSNILKPKKTYAPLFQSHEGASLQLKPLPPSPQKPHRHSPVQTAAPKIATSVPAPSLLTRLASWFFPSYASERNSVKDNSHQLLWTRNHYLLLDHIYRVPFSTHSQLHNNHPPSLQDRLTTAYHSPIPSTLQEFIGHTFTTTPDFFDDDDPNTKRESEIRTYSLQLTEPHIRTAHAFILEVQIEGVPWLCDGAFFTDDVRSRNTAKQKRKRVEFEEVEEEEEKQEEEEQQEQQQGESDKRYPLRGADGRVVRTREEWGAREVCLRVFSLWVGDCARAGERDLAE